ncbi:MAG: helix-turn-helix transcriptional regulator [Peptostreptococcaceae bacterium]|nr:helix-turn-helix transcriptional regulator [Peptostreptococcaceae bacterium]
MNINQIGQNILYYLKDQQLTQVDLATGLGTSKQVVNKIVKGKKALKMEELIAISQYLNIEFDKLVNGKREVEIEELEAVHLYGTIENRKTADYILNLVSNLSYMEEELAAHGLLE